MKPFTKIASLLLGLIALMQGLRFALAWPVTVNGFAVPLWASAVVCLALAAISIMLWREGRS